VPLANMLPNEIPCLRNLLSTNTMYCAHAYHEHVFTGLVHQILCGLIVRCVSAFRFSTYVASFFILLTASVRALAAFLCATRRDWFICEYCLEIPFSWVHTNCIVEFIYHYETAFKFEDKLAATNSAV